MPIFVASGGTQKSLVGTESVPNLRGEDLTYVLITPARNEQDFIEWAIQSVITQTRLPKRWVIVSDGSTDRTDEIVRQYLPAYPWMQLVRMPERDDRHFAAKARCFAAGFDQVRHESFHLVGNLDADISFDNDYFEFLLDRFAVDPSLGVAGTPFLEGIASYDFRFTSPEHVSGACQIFRRECFERIGGYVQLRSGGIDWVAVTTARMKGWRTRTFVERTCRHHRPMGTASNGRLKAAFRLGQQDFSLGGHPLWQVFRSFYQMRRRPYLLGGLCLLSGYASLWLRKSPRQVSAELVRFHQREQMQRLRHALSQTIHCGVTTPQ